MRRILVFVMALLTTSLLLLPVMASDGNVLYDGDAKECIFAPGSEYSPTDLFPNFKDVMPGDSLTQKITVKSDVADGTKVKIYMRALGAHPDSVEFLSKLHLRVAKSEANEMAYMFDAAANETAQLTDWVLLGTLYSGGEVNLDVTLDVPVELDNNFKHLVGYLDWEFMIEEYPTEPGDPVAPDTGDNRPVGLWIGLMALGFSVILVMLFVRKKKT